MNDFIVWLIIAAFYAPLHYMMPIMIVFLRSDSTEERKTRIKKSIISSTLSMIVAFTVVVWLVMEKQMSLAMGVLFLALLVPIGHAVFLSKGRLSA